MTGRRSPNADIPSLGDRHALIVGGTRRGKSGLIQLLARRIPPSEGLTLVDPHGSCARAVLEYLANPAHGRSRRVVHLIDACGASAVGINPLEPYADTPEAWHDAANTLASAVESRFEASPEETPRLSRLLYVGGTICARHRLTLIELLELFTIGGDALRDAVLTDFDNAIVRRELEDLHLLAERSPREFLALVESCRNRLVRWLGDRRLQRLLGQSRGLSPRAVMDTAEIVVADLSALAYADAALVGTILSSMYVAAARRRPALQGAPHHLVIDEAESMITVDTARGADQVAKYGLFLNLAIQRLGQVRARGDFIADALFVNCGVKICFGGLDPESARFMAEMLFLNSIDLEEWKPGSARPTVVGIEKVITRGRVQSRNRAAAEAIGEGSVRSSARFVASTDALMSSWGTVFSSGTTATFIPTATDAIVTSGTSDGSTRQRAGGRSRANARGEQSGEAAIASRNRIVGSGESDGVSEQEAFVPRYENLPTQMYSLEEQLARAAGELMALSRRECIIRVESDAPVRTRTRDLAPAFASATFRNLCLPLYLAKIAAASPYARSVEAVDAEIKARRAHVLDGSGRSPDPDFTAPEADPRVVPLPSRPRLPFPQR